MMPERPSPFVCHVFVCTNDREGKRKSCADGDSPAVREALKDAVEKRGWRGRVRVSQSGCLGLCADGPNVILYPQGVWFAAVAPADVPAILARIEALLA
jgi:(2Fe-2S) ferredoxin